MLNGFPKVEDNGGQLIAGGRVSRWTVTTRNGVPASTSIKQFQFEIGSYDSQTRAVLFASFMAMVSKKKSIQIVASIILSNRYSKY